MEKITHNSTKSVRRLDQLDLLVVSSSGRRAWFPNFQ